jgi:glycosyltransferase involved in cell wall biosynthesis
VRRRIIVISEDFVEPWDEGIKNYARNLGVALGEAHEVLLLNVDRSGVGGGALTTRVPPSRTFSHPRLGRRIARFDPDMIVYVPSPSSTLASFARSFFLRRHAPRAAVGMVALIPRSHGRLARPFIAGARPHVLFVPSYRSLLRASRFSVDGELVAVGVETQRFRPAGEGEKRELRRRYGIAEGAYVYLHVGHLSPRRNLDALIPLAARGDSEVVVITSTSTPGNASIRSRLEDARVRVIREVVPVEEFYRLADCYVFPVIDSEGSVEIPLSVLEAMASGLPVLARPFGGLRDHLPEGDDLRYFDTPDELMAHADALRRNGGVTVRPMDPFEWSSVAARIVAVLEERLEA